MLGSYIPILVMLILAAVIACVMVGASALLGPRHPTRFKAAPYECGMTPVGSARERFPVKFYMIAMLFIIFDIETIFLYPWAVIFKDSARITKLFLLVEMGLFVAILFVGYFYIWGKGALDWNEGQEEMLEKDPRVFRKRPPILLGNENSGPVQLPAVVQTSEEDYFGTEVKEEHHPPAAVGGQ
jgi:NADH-quinone oxidoreductase subunit A